MPAQIIEAAQFLHGAQSALGLAKDANTAAQLAPQIIQQPKEDFFDKLIEAMRVFDSMLGKSQDLIAMSKSIAARKNALNPPVASDGPAPAVHVPQAIESPKREEIIMPQVHPIDTLDIAAVVAHLREQIPSDWQKKTVDEILREYESLGGLQREVVDYVIRKRIKEALP